MKHFIRLSSLALSCVALLVGFSSAFAGWWGSSGPMNLGEVGRSMASEVQRRIKVWAALAGLPTDVHPHMLRHSFASHVLQSSGDLRAVQEMLGHASISSTQVYTHLDFQHLAKIYDAAHPRAKRVK